jgi:hypothetical protein
VEKHKSLFPYFGGKSKIAPVVWEKLGEVRNYVEPFCGSGAVFFQKPFDCTSTLNDSSGLMVNLWRGIQRQPDAVAGEAAKLLGEADLHAAELQALSIRDEISKRCEADLDYFDPVLAGRYIFGLCNKIGSFAVEGGPWINHDGVLTDRRELPRLGDAGTGICRKLPRLGDAGTGISRLEYIKSLMAYYSAKLERARLTCGDWARVAKSRSVTTYRGLTGIFLDPPYETSGDLYADHGVFREVVDWAKGEENNPELRIVLAGYACPEVSKTLEGWEEIAWKQRGGYGGGKNSSKERLWVSPTCAKPKVDEFTLS